MEITTGTGTGTDAEISFADHGRDNAWITIIPDNRHTPISLNIVRTDEGIIVDLYPLDEEDGQPIDSAHAHYAEADED